MQGDDDVISLSITFVRCFGGGAGRWTPTPQKVSVWFNIHGQTSSMGAATNCSFKPGPTFRSISLAGSCQAAGTHLDHGGQRS